MSKKGVTSRLCFVGWNNRGVIGNLETVRAVAATAFATLPAPQVICGREYPVAVLDVIIAAEHERLRFFTKRSHRYFSCVGHIMILRGHPAREPY